MSDPRPSSDVPTEHVDPAEPRRGRSVVIVYTGDGKGKSSAAWGSWCGPSPVAGRWLWCSS
jgi:ATP:corrinoid adenosyltransferase